MPRIARRGEVNYGAFDVFTIAHAAAGVAMGVAGVSRSRALAVAIGWEIVEPILKTALPGAFPHATIDTMTNKTTDVVAVMAGWWVVSRG